MPHPHWRPPSARPTANNLQKDLSPPDRILPGESGRTCSALPEGKKLRKVSSTENRGRRPRTGKTTSPPRIGLFREGLGEHAVESRKVASESVVDSKSGQTAKNWFTLQLAAPPSGDIVAQLQNRAKTVAIGTAGSGDSGEKISLDFVVDSKSWSASST